MSGATASFALARRANGDAWLGLRERWSRAEIAAAVVNVAIAFAIVWAFHDRFWWAPDEGVYAYVADRLRGGEVLNRDLHDIHAGYVHFLHAVAFDLFGRDLVSLRYPLALLTVIQSALVFLILRPLLGPLAICGGLAMSALTFVQFLNPSANWYALFLTVVLIALLAGRAERSTFGLMAIGFVVAALVLFRQLTGVLVGMGAVAYLLMPGQGARALETRPRVAWFIAASMAMALAAYLWLETDPAAFVLYGMWPLAALIVAGVRMRLNDGRALQLIAALLAGAALAALPLLLYHLSHGSLGHWWDDTVASAVSLTGLEFFRQSSYATLLALAVKGAVDFSDPVAMINGAFWVLSIGASFLLGIAVLRTLLQDEGKVHPLPFVALFHALVSAHYAIPIYALFSVGLTFAGWLALARQPVLRAVVIAATLFAVAVGFTFQAAQPLSRGLDGIIRGERVALGADGLPGAGLRIEREDQAMYARVLNFIDAHAGPHEPILGLPMSPELYFLSNRKPPVRFAIAPLGLRSELEMQQASRRLAASMPAVILYKPDDKYTTTRVRELMDRMRPSLRFCERIGPFELYARQACKVVP